MFVVTDMCLRSPCDSTANALSDSCQSGGVHGIYSCKCKHNFHWQSITKSCVLGMNINYYSAVIDKFLHIV